MNDTAYTAYTPFKTFLSLFSVISRCNALLYFIFPGGRTIPKCTRVLYNIHSVNHDPALWKDPDAFRPERFLDPVTGQICKRHLQSLMTFGVGLRACPGEKLANAEVFLVFVRLMQRVSVSSPMDGSGVDTTTVRYNVLTYPAMQNIIYTRRYTE